MIDYTQLGTLAAVLRTGSFEAAAADLAITQSAVSQRIKTLEDRMGTVLVLRETPTRATEMGARLFRHYENVGLLERGLDLPADQHAPAAVRIAMNADSLATWGITALSLCDDFLYDVVVDDQDHSADWLRKGEVVAAVTAREKPVHGCDAFALGPIRYSASASPAFVKRWFPDGVTAEALAQAPAMTFNQKDSLQRDWILRKTGQSISVRTHWIPSTQGFIDGAIAGLGWGMNPTGSIEDQLADGRLVSLDPDLVFEVPLYWQVNRRVAAAINDLTQSVRAAARLVL